MKMTSNTSTLYANRCLHIGALIVKLSLIHFSVKPPFFSLLVLIFFLNWLFYHHCIAAFTHVKGAFENWLLSVGFYSTCCVNILYFGMSTFACWMVHVVFSVPHCLSYLSSDRDNDGWGFQTRTKTEQTACTALQHVSGCLEWYKKSIFFFYLDDFFPVHLLLCHPEFEAIRSKLWDICDSCREQEV